MKYTRIKNRPVAKFYYKGNHSHPVRRTVVITEQNKNLIKGYELREGTAVRELDDDCPVKSYLKDKIATTSQLRSGSSLRDNNNTSTMQRISWRDFQEVGI